MANEPTLKATAQLAHLPSSPSPHHKPTVITYTSLPSDTLSLREEEERFQKKETEEELLGEKEKQENEEWEKEENIVRCPCGTNKVLFIHTTYVRICTRMHSCRKTKTPVGSKSM